MAMLNKTDYSKSTMQITIRVHQKQSYTLLFVVILDQPDIQSLDLNPLDTYIFLQEDQARNGRARIGRF
jgi:hypothetical protein